MTGPHDDEITKALGDEPSVSPPGPVPITHSVSGDLHRPTWGILGETTPFAWAGAAWPFGAGEKVLARCTLRLTDG